MGVYTAFVGIVIFQGSKSALSALNSLKDPRKSKSEIEAAFSSFDSDKNGYLDVKEVACLCSSLGYSLNKNELESALFILDSNSDGKVTVDEFIEWWNEM